MLENYTKAKDVIAELIYLQPKNARAHNILGSIYQKLNILDDARDEFKKAIEIDPKFTDAYVNLSINYASDNKWDEAKNILLDALEKTEKTPDLFNALGTVFFSLKKTKEGLEYFKKSIKIDENFEKGWFNIAEAYKQLGDSENERLARNKIEEIQKLKKLNKVVLKK
jgi:Tfp pilus assembly protein PilF